MYVCVSYPKKEIINYIDQQGNIQGKVLMDVQLMKTMNKEIDNNGDNRNSVSN